MKISEDNLLQCPTCGFDYTTIWSVVMYARPDGEDGRCTAVTVDHQGQVTEVEQSDPEARGRRHSIVLVGSCENGHEFETEIRQHKGQTQLLG